MFRTRHLALPCLSALIALAGCADDDAASADYDPNYEPGAYAPPPEPAPGQPIGTFEDVGENAWVDAAEDPLSTFSIDVDTASYTIMRRSITGGWLPDPASVRIEEYINFFSYDYPAPTLDDPEPFAIHLEGAPSPFGPELHLLRVGIKGAEVPAGERLPANLVFLVDVSGSMHSADKIGLVKYSLGQLLDGLHGDDTVALVTYASRDEVLLTPTPVRRRGEIMAAVDGLSAGGSTNGAAGITTAYDLAESAFAEEGINRVVLCTDGDFNVGVTGEALVQLVESWRDRGIFLTVLGFGTGNLNDAFIENLTNRGEGNYAYIDSQREAQRMLGEQLVGTLQTIAKDVKIQVEFDPAAVRRFRLVGYENRVLNHDDFVDDTVDAGEIGAGHTVTALYEVELQDARAAADTALATVRVRHKAPGGGDSLEIARGLPMAALAETIEAASADLRFAAAVAEFAEILSESSHTEGADFGAILTLLAGADVTSAGTGERSEFAALVEQARMLWSRR